ncbi:uncharacterized protein DS421_4g126590 [Arachis hypogaea]|nr:uncharacterized protein DS421_4g126590 [Arachis hypogaea]
MSNTEAEHHEEEEAPTGEDEDTGAQVAPIVRLEEERGVGTVKFLKHKETGKVRLLMRQSKTLKIYANHLILPLMSVQEHSGNEKLCVWHARDFANGELKDEREG